MLLKYRIKAYYMVMAIFITYLLISGCDKGKEASKQTPKPQKTLSFSIVSGSENKGLEPIIKAFGKKNGVKFTIKYMGSVDMTLALMEQGARTTYDAIWPANSLWISLGDKNRVVKHSKSIMRSPVVLGVRTSIARDLGWVDKPVYVRDILEKTNAGKLRFAMTSATQSNSGASAFLGFLHAMSGTQDVLKMAHLEDKAVQDKVRDLLSRVDRSSGSSGWLKDTLVNHYDRFHAMFNYEAMIIEANRKLLSMGKEPLYAIYPVDGIMIADSPLGYIDKGKPDKEALFKKLQDYLLSDAVQRKILSLGRRTGLVGLNPETADNRVFNPAWGIDINRIISSIPTPQEAVIRRALELYQIVLRKPSCTAYVVDVSGSMQGKGITDLKAAMTTLLDPAQAKRYMLQASGKDIHIIVPFNGRPRQAIKKMGNSPETMSQLLTFVHGLQAGGGTDIYAAAARGLRLISETENLDQYFPAVILMTDGQSKGSINTLKKIMDQLPMGHDIPIHSITFGNASEKQLNAISQTTIGRVFHGKDLIKAFRNAKGYN